MELAYTMSVYEIVGALIVHYNVIFQEWMVLVTILISLKLTQRQNF
jgi:hypothetical protein